MDWLSGITAFDVLILIIFIGFLVRGIMIGFIRQISSLVAMIGGFALAGYFDNEFYRLILPYIDNSHTAFFLTYILLFVAFFYLIKLAGLGLKKVMDVSLTTWFDRTVGGLFGLIKGIFFTSLLFVFIGSFLSGSNNYLKKSISYPVLSSTSNVILSFIQDHDLRSYFKPKEPAIKLLPFKKSSDSGGRKNFVEPESENSVLDSQPQDPERMVYL
ncbi:CvpA family protein [Thermodesulfobacteriota bacterium]